MKPKKEIFDFALQTTGATLNQSIMIGDALAIDVLGAKNVGMDQVYYNPYKIPHTEQPTYEVAHLAELKNIFI
jgi:putative hydrolase of the HAD superfamily